LGSYPGFFSDEKKLLEFAKVIGVSDSFIREKRREALHRYMLNQAPYLHTGNGIVH
jgi:hypothetical protein